MGIRLAVVSLLGAGLLAGCASPGAVPPADVARRGPSDTQILEACMTTEVPAALKRLGIDNAIRTREDAGAFAHWLCKHVVISCTSAPGGDACRGVLERYGIGDTKPVATLGTALFDAAFKGATASVRQRLAEGADVNYRNVGGWSPVMIAAAERHLETVVVLLEAKADPNLRNHYGRTALMFAAGYGDVPIVQRLLAAGADPNLVPSDHSGWTALMAAAARGHGAVVEALLRAGADVSIRARDGRTALELARGEGHPDVVRALQAAAVPRS